jgi:phospholipase C
MQNDATSADATKGDSGGNCPVVSVAVADTAVGTTFAVDGAGSASGAGKLTYAWSAPSGTFDTPKAAQANFQCAAPGPVTLTLTVSDSEDKGTACKPAVGTVQVTCGHTDAAAALKTATKIKHLIVIFGENISFDHYFGTYPTAQNNTGEVAFTSATGTPPVNTLVTPLDPTKGFAPVTVDAGLLANNPNFKNVSNDAGVANPFRLAPSQAATEDETHNYKPEQEADDDGGMDLFPLYTGFAGPPPNTPDAAATTGLVMAYFDGNTVSAMWGYAQKYALSDNAWTTNFGPSTPGAINLISGQTNGFAATNRSPTLMAATHVVADGNGGYTLIGDTDPLNDVCSTAADQTNMAGKNVGDLLNTKGVSWGWFEGGFDLTITNANGTTGCNRLTVQTVPNPAYYSNDYVPHHQPFQYYPSTANPTHARPSSVAAVGSSTESDGKTAEPANHQYDSHDFFDALQAGNLPAVVYLKAPAFQDGHPGNSDPIDEQNFVTSVVNALQAAQEWSTSAVVVTYDDSDGWYDHQMPPIVNPSASVADALNGTGICNNGVQQGDGGAAPTTPLLGSPLADGGTAPAEGRCGYGTRIPLLVISPFAKKNFIDHTLLDQTSVLKFVEDNWLAGQRIQPGGSFDTIANSIASMLTGI